MLRSSLALLAVLLVSGCGKRVIGPEVTRADIATVERAVTYCTAATASLSPALAHGDANAISYAAIDARNRCMTARTDLAKIARISPDLAVCQKDVEAQERVATAQLSVMDGTSAERREAVVAALNEAIKLQSECGRAVDRLKRGG